MQDNALTDSALAANDLLIVSIGNANALAARPAGALGVEAGRNHFHWRGRTYGNPDEGVFAAGANPWNPSRAVYCFVANSPLQLWQMLKRWQPLPSWAVFRGEQTVEKGFTGGL